MLVCENSIPYEDIQIKEKNWPKLKAKTPTGQLSFLKAKGDTMAHIMVMAQYLSEEFDSYGNNDKAREKANEILDNSMAAIYKAAYEKDEENKVKFADVSLNNMPLDIGGKMPNMLGKPPARKI